MSSSCCYSGFVPKDGQVTHLKTSSVFACCGKIGQLTVNDLIVTNSAVLPNPNPTPTTTVPYGVFNIVSGGTQVVANGDPPALLTGGTFAGVNVTNPTAGSSQFQVADAGRYDVQVIVTGSAAAGGGSLNIFFDGTDIGDATFAGIFNESVAASAYPFLAANQTVDVTITWNGGTPITLLYVAIKISRLGDT